MSAHAVEANRPVAPTALNPAVDIVVPVHNEEADLEPSVRRLHSYLTQEFPFSARITIADNASTDGTWPLATRLAEELPGVRAEHLTAKGRGRALKQAWGTSDATVLAYMDVDLSTDLGALLPLVAPLLSGHSDVAIGTRLARSAQVHRGAKRELISRCYNLILHAALTTRFSDAQCGFKAIRADRAEMLLPLVEDDAWFFDTELLVLAERSGLRIHEVPVDWVDDPDSRVDLVHTALEDLRGVLRMGRGLASGALPVSELRRSFGRAGDGHTGMARQALRFGAVGVASTLAYLLLFLLLRPAVGAQAANFLALGSTAVANTAANRRWTFSVRGREGAGRHQAQGLLVFGAALALTAGSLALLHMLSAPSHALELLVLVAANLAATVLRFVALRGWVFRRAVQP
ncbi:MAG: gtuS2-8 [Frankiales bacterium]|nr:gtuS2-8 [Frankiales bacterium]MCW2708483.1 gtuS2-8 [Frankiales bacterium]